MGCLDTLLSAHSSNLSNKIRLPGRSPWSVGDFSSRNTLCGRHYKYRGHESVEETQGSLSVAAAKIGSAGNFPLEARFGERAQHAGLRAAAPHTRAYSYVVATARAEKERRAERERESVLPGSLQLADADAVFGLDSLMTLGKRCGSATTWNT